MIITVIFRPALDSLQLYVVVFEMLLTVGAEIPSSSERRAAAGRQLHHTCVLAHLCAGLLLKCCSKSLAPIVAGFQCRSPISLGCR